MYDSYIYIYNLVPHEVSIIKLVSVAEQAGLSLNLSGIPKTGFLAKGPIYLHSPLSTTGYIVPIHAIPPRSI